MKKRNIFRGKVVRRAIILHTVQLSWNILSCCCCGFFSLFCLAFFSIFAVFMLFFFLFFFQSLKITTALLMYLEDDYPLRLGFSSWTRPGEPHHPRCNRQEQKEWRGKERREARIPLSYNKEHSQIFTTTTTTTTPRTPLTSSTAAVQPACREDSSILISPWERDILRHIDHSLLTAVINSDNSELNEKFYFCLSVPLLHSCIRCAPLSFLVWHRCCTSPPPPAKSNI